MYAGCPLQADCYFVREMPGTGNFDRSCWAQEVKPRLKQLNPLINLPYVVDGDVVVTQSNACMAYLGRKFGMMGKNERELVDCEQLLCECMDIRNAVVGYSYGRDQQKAEDFLKHRVGSPGGSLDKLELWLSIKKSKGESVTFFVGESATAPDFHIWEMMSQLLFIAKFSNLDDSEAMPFPLLKQFHQEFGSLPNNQKYLASKLFRLPLNNKSALTIGATPTGHVYQPGQLCDWEDASGIY